MRGAGTAAAAIVALVLALVPAVAEAAGARGELIHRYSPIVMLRTSDSLPCDDSAEQFEPTTVDVVLDNPRVDLISPPGDDTKPLAGPTAADLAGLGKGWYLDLPGDPLSAGCTYATDFAGLVADGDAPPITYAHIRRMPGEQQLVVQYWFYYYFNQFNDVHESDWEGMQIVFDAASPRAALEAGPSEIGLFQHGGGERAGWTDSKVEKRDDHPIVYPAAGSHATFYASAIYIENGRKGSGVGCDNASEPVREVTPTPVAVPTHPAPGSRFDWLTYEGRWGQKESGFNNGPTGPNTKQQWLDPIKTQESLRQLEPGASRRGAARAGDHRRLLRRGGARDRAAEPGRPDDARGDPARGRDRDPDHLPAHPDALAPGPARARCARSATSASSSGRRASSTGGTGRRWWRSG